MLWLSSLRLLLQVLFHKSCLPSFFSVSVCHDEVTTLTEQEKDCRRYFAAAPPVPFASSNSSPSSRSTRRLAVQAGAAATEVQGIPRQHTNLAIHHYWQYFPSRQQQQPLPPPPPLPAIVLSIQGGHSATLLSRNLEHLPRASAFLTGKAIFSKQNFSKYSFVFPEHSINRPGSHERDNGLPISSSWNPSSSVRHWLPCSATRHWNGHEITRPTREEWVACHVFRP